MPPSASEAGRLLCAGTYLDGTFRDQVIDELYVHEERLTAPSYGYDAARVLAHALRARRAELLWAAAVIGAWFFAALVTDGLFLLLLGPCLLLSLSGWLTGLARRSPRWVRLPVFLVRLYARLSLLFVLAMLVAAGFFAEGPDPYSSDGGSVLDGLYGDSYGSSYGSGPDVGDLLGDLLLPDLDALTKGSAWAVLALFLGVSVLKGLQRGQFARVLAAELAPQRYPDLAGDPAEQAAGARFARVRGRIRAEQHWPLVMYEATEPFRGAGLSYRPWNLSVELRPRTGLEEGRKPVAVDNAQILREVVPLLERLRVPSPHGSPRAAAAVQDRLRELVVDECVFLPARGLPDRDRGPFGLEDIARHRAESVEEGDERRRHFLRIRVGGWDEEIVVTVFVRVHTQGGMLMLEVAPHVLPPVRRLFQDADELAHRFRHNNPVGKAVWALAHTPGALGSAFATLARGAVSSWRILVEGNGGARPDGPALSVRELGADAEASLFQIMDVDRYLKTIEDRVQSGVKTALHRAGWQTGDFEQKIVNLGAGATYVGSLNNSAVNFGQGGSARNVNNQQGVPTDGGAGGGGR